MGAEEMREIAAIVHAVLDATTAAADSKARYTLDAAVRDQAKGRAGDLLDRFPLYPGIAL
jgi:glycine hydroxymethyltransferase